MDGTQIIDTPVLGARDPSIWHIEGTGDFNGDGRDDILWRNASGVPEIWYVNGGQFFTDGFFAAQPAAWHIVGQQYDYMCAACPDGHPVTCRSALGGVSRIISSLRTKLVRSWSATSFATMARKACKSAAGCRTPVARSYSCSKLLTRASKTSLRHMRASEPRMPRGIVVASKQATFAASHAASTAASLKTTL